MNPALHESHTHTHTHTCNTLPSAPSAMNSPPSYSPVQSTLPCCCCEFACCCWLCSCPCCWLCCCGWLCKRSPNRPGKRCVMVRRSLRNAEQAEIPMVEAGRMKTHHDKPCLKSLLAEGNHTQAQQHTLTHTCTLLLQPNSEHEQQTQQGEGAADHSCVLLAASPLLVL